MVRARPESGTSRSKPRDPKVAALGRERNPLVKLLRVLGPGFITGASDDDPSGIATYASAGARFGYGPLWLALLTLPLQAAIQYVCAKIALVTGKGLAGVLRQHYSRLLLYPVVVGLLVANTINAGADLGAIAAAVNLLVPALNPTPLVLPIALAILGLQVFGTYRLIARVFQWLAVILVGYVGAAILARPDVGAVLSGTFLPSLSLDPGFLAMLVAVLGTTISPYLFFWQASHEVETQIDMGRRRLWQRQGATDRELSYAGLDVTAGMAFSNIVMYFVILATAATLHASGRSDIASAAEAAEALRPIAGDLAAALLGIGLIGGGVLAVPILTGSAAYALSEAFGWPYGLDRNPGRAPQFYAVIAVATIVGVAINYLGINPIDALVATAVINGLLAPPLIGLILWISNDRRIMGSRTNSRPVNLAGWAAFAIMTAAAVVLLATTLLG